MWKPTSELGYRNTAWTFANLHGDNVAWGARNLISTQPVAVALEEDLAGARQLGVEEAFSSTTTRAAAARRPHVEFDAVLPCARPTRHHLTPSTRRRLDGVGRPRDRNADDAQETSEFVSTRSVSPGASVLCVMTPIAPINAMPSPLMTWRIRPWPPQQQVRGFVEGCCYTTITGPGTAWVQSMPWELYRRHMGVVVQLDKNGNVKGVS